VHDKYVRRRRVLLGVLVAISLILLTAYFGEAENSPLHSVQRGIVEVFTPIQDGASKVFSPVRDLTGWISSTIHAKSQNSQLRREAAQATVNRAQYQYVMNQNAQLRKLVGLDNRLNLQNDGPVAAGVTAYDPVVWYETMKVDKGSDAGVRVDDPVVSGGGLVGKVSSVGANYAEVEELSAPNYQVEATVQDGANAANGTMTPSAGDPTNLQVQYLSSNAQISTGDEVVTAGYADPHNKLLRSPYPPGIPIGRVSAVDYNTFPTSGTVDMSPVVDLRSVSLVQILTKVRQ
jgi:rod shape-determining protein MreC